MKFRSRTGQKHSISGFTLIELLVATSLAGIIVAVAAPNAYNILTSVQRNKEHMAILTDFQHLGFWLSHDVQMAESSNLINNGPTSSILSVSWFEQYNEANTTHYAIYSLINNEVSRNYDGFYRTVSWHIASIAFSMVDGRIEATSYSVPYYGNPGGQRRDYVFSPRP